MVGTCKPDVHKIYMYWEVPTPDQSKNEDKGNDGEPLHGSALTSFANAVAWGNNCDVSYREELSESVFEIIRQLSIYKQNTSARVTSLVGTMEVLLLIKCFFAFTHM